MTGGKRLKKRIMIVDDSRVVYLQIKKLLQDTEFEIVDVAQWVEGDDLPFAENIGG